MNIKALRGTKDIFAPEILYWYFIENQAKQVFNLANFQEIRTPIFEKKELFERGIGSDTDIVSKEMYTFQDKKERFVTLRPEGTASIVRAFIEHKLYAENNLQKFWYLGPMFRYERPQSGRQRQFHQLGVECIGTNDPLMDAEVINLSIQLLKAFNLNNYKLEINSVGELNDRIKYKQALIEYLIPYKEDLDPDSQARLISNPIRILDTKDQKTLEILQKAPTLFNFLSLQSRQHLEDICNYLTEYKITYTINHLLVRGLDYYTNTAFEIKMGNLGAQDTICGGGRYNDLILQLGGPNIPAIGWAMGVERLLMLVKSQHTFSFQEVDFYIVTSNNLARMKAVRLVQTLRKDGYRVEFDLSGSSFSKQIKKASQLNAVACLIIGDTELAEDTLSIKWLKIHQQEIIPFQEINLLKEKYYQYKN
uniref:histidine-tRNA synthetase n=1 Tax=Glaucosphaera vacuolata TaxID=38265 RepID=UPI001FCDD072|nr:histidine-tRNA synthetase [Glaucosphaera vacuolata]UNJ18742.1 histidine-tRNA synthetase [Glaucosphaera vacuolata]